MKNKRVSVAEVFGVFQYQGMATPNQISKLLGISLNQVTYAINNLMRKPDAKLWYQPVTRTWIHKKVGGRPENVYALEPIGAKDLSQLMGVEITAPNRETVEKNVLHSLALVDIASYCINQNFTVRVNRRINSTEVDTYILPDIEFCIPGDKKYFVELEQTRFQNNLEVKVLERMLRWEQILSEEGSSQYSKEIYVLFNLDKKTDDYTILTWMQAYDELYKSINKIPSFNVWYREFEDFYKEPSFKLNSFTRLEPNRAQATEKIRSTREQEIKAQKDNRLELLDESKFDNRIKAYWEENREQFHQAQLNTDKQIFFFLQVRKLFDMCTVYDNEYTGYANASLPLLSIAVVRTWLEMPELAELRAKLIIAITTVYNSYIKGLNSAAAALERAIWDVLFRYFGFASGGPLIFYVVVGNADQIKDRSNDLVPTVKINAPWKDVCEEEEARQIEKALTWFVNLLFRYHTELGLNKSPSRRK
jgi:hypothetical protein